MASTQGARSRKRTAKQAIQTDKFEIQGIQKEKQRRTKQFQKEAGSYRGATQMAIGQVQRQNLGGLRGTPEGNQLAKEYAGRIRDLRKSLPFTLAPVQREYKADIQGLESDLGAAQLGLQQDRQDKLAAIADIAAAQKEEVAEVATNQAEKRAGVDSAYKEALKMIRMQDLVNKDPNTEDEDKRQIPPKTELDWLKFEEALASQEGVDPRSARKAVAALQRRLGYNAPIAGVQSLLPKKFKKRFQAPLG